MALAAVCGEAHGGGSQHLLPAIFFIFFICRDGSGRHDSFQNSFLGPDHAPIRLYKSIRRDG